MTPARTRNSRVAAGALILALTACRAAVDPRATSDVFAAADSLLQGGRAAPAAVAYRALMDSLGAAGDSAQLWKAALWWADAERRLGHRDSAAAGFDAAARLAQHDSARLGWVALQRANLLDNQGTLPPAMDQANQALSLALASHDERLQASAYHELARIHSISGHYRDAYQENSAALRIFRRIGPRQAVALELNELVIDYRHLGRFTDALAASDESIAIYRAIGRTDAMFWVLGNTANVWRELGEPARALAVLTEANRELDQVSDLRPKALGLQALADLYLDQHMWSFADGYSRRALAINRRAHLPYSETSNLIALARITLAGSGWDSSDVYLREALGLADSIGYRREGVTIRTLLARLATRRRQPAAALRWSAGALALADSLGDPDARVEAREARGAALESVRPRDAANTYLDAIDLLESWRGRVATGDLQWGVTQPWGGVYEGAIRTLLGLGEPAAAWQVAERARARLLLQLITGRDAASTADDPHARLVQRLRDEYEIVNGDDPDERRHADSAIDRIGLALDSMETQARRRDPAAGMRYAPAPDLSQVRRDLLGDGRGMLVYFWGDRAVYGWFVSADGIRAARLGRADSLSAIVRFLNGILQQPSTDTAWVPAARNVYRRLVAPLLPGRASQLIVIADGPLTRTPFEALVPEGDGRPWGATTEITYGPSAMVLTALAVAGRTGAWRRTLLAVGDPAGRAVGNAGDLPFAATEARTVGGMFPPGSSDVLIGAKATQESWMDRDPSRYRYLHFASHAIADDRNPQRSRIVLADRDLDVPAIEQLHLHADLVSLSGCETALGKNVRGEGVIGLPYAFLAAGARAVLVSLWRVDDRVAATFMTDFYRRLESGMSAADALRATRTSWLTRKGTDGHPDRWAAFVLVGGVPPRGGGAISRR